MKKILLAVAVAIMTAMSAQAQKIQTVDKNGQPIPYASIFTEAGDIIGRTTAFSRPGKISKPQREKRSRPMPMSKTTGILMRSCPKN